MMNFIVICMLMMIVSHSIAGHSSKSRPIPKYDKGSGEPIRPVAYEENMKN